jgi:CHAD domain-containing protein
MVKAKEIGGLDCGAGDARGMRLVLLARLEELCEHRAAALDTQSDDGVHDMRVASRRLRSVLRDFRPHLHGGKRLEEARTELKRLARALGAVRDEDVAIRALEKLEAEATDVAGEGLKVLVEERRARRRSARASLAPELDTETFDATRRRIALAFERATEQPEKSVDGEGEQSFSELGRSVIVRSWEELQERGAGIYRPLKSKRLHRIRIAAKRLRYALELFAACFGGAKELARDLAGLQKALGNLHDCDEWIKVCGEYLSERGAVEDTGVGESARREAAHWLLQHFLNKRDAHYIEALAIWRGWEREGFGSRLFECLNTGAVVR